MRKMKESGVEWIGKIPEKWLLVKYKRYCDVFAGGTPDTAKSEYYDGEIPWIQSGKIQNCDITDCSRYITELGVKNSSTKFIPRNTALLAMTGATCGNVGFSKINLYANQSVMAFVNTKEMDSRFIYYSLFVQKDGILINQNGGAQAGINVENGKNLYVPYPAIDEQVKIAKVLDDKISKIDSVIQKTKETIEDYKKYKRLLITDVVTKGLNKNVEMNNSGVKWIGTIPKTWKIIKLKFLFEAGSLKIGPFGSALTGKTLAEGLVKIYNQANLIENNFALSRHYIDEETFNELKNYEIIPGDILFSMMGTVGKCKIMPNGYSKGIMDSHLIKARLNNNLILNEFFEYVYDKDYSNVIIEQLLYYSNGTIMNGLNSTILKNVSIAIPDINEQLQIVNYLKKKTKEIDNLINSKSKIIEELEQYKKSLIYEYVTGKKEVV